MIVAVKILCVIILLAIILTITTRIGIKWFDKF